MNKVCKKTGTVYREDTEGNITVPFWTKDIKVTIFSLVVFSIIAAVYFLN